MADLKISQLPAATVPLAGSEVLPIVQSGTTKQVSITNVLAGAASLGANTFTAAQEWATGTAVASAATINLNTTTGNRVHITGTTTITAVTLTRGPRTLIFDGILTLTHNATTNSLPGAANITTAVGDRAIYESDGTTVYCVSYIKVSGTAVVVAPAPNGLVLLSTVVASNSATVDMETTFNSTYDQYLITISAYRPQTSNTALHARFKQGGSYTAAGYQYHSSNLATALATYAATASASATEIVIAPGISSSFVSNFDIRIPTPTVVDFPRLFGHGAFFSAVAGSVSQAIPMGYQNDTSGAIQGVRFLSSSGNITAGTFRLYGIANS
jgi:hypothetical protein